MPEAEIRFAARTGFLSKRIWRKFFAEGGERWQRKNWSLLSSRGFFAAHRSRRARDVLVLNSCNKGVRAVVGDNISSPPFVAQLDHDELVAISLLRLAQSGAISSYQTESELKRYFPVVRNYHISNEREKFPDALVEVMGGPTVALELELTLKTRKRYREILQAYRSRKMTGKIVFIVRSAAIFESIKQGMQDIHYPVHERPVGFAWLDEWEENPVSARIQFKSSSTSIEEIAFLNRSINDTAKVPERNF